MNPLLLDFLLSAGKNLIEKLIPDKEKQAEAQLELLKISQQQEIQDKANAAANQLAQIDVNKTEAQSTNLFVSGWRPGAGWVCVASFAVKFVAIPIAVFTLDLIGKKVAIPPLDISEAMTMLGGLLGLGYFRSKEKQVGVA